MATTKLTLKVDMSEVREFLTAVERRLARKPAAEREVLLRFFDQARAAPDAIVTVIDRGEIRATIGAPLYDWAEVAGLLEISRRG